jgi:ElaB/YqjD/DUF883 family membrane-anchored ribosome-binding protein
MSSSGTIQSAIGSSSVGSATPYPDSTSNIAQNGLTFTLPPNTNITNASANAPTVQNASIISTATPPPLGSGAVVGDPASMLNSLQYYLVNSPLLQSNNGDNDNAVQQIQDINQSMTNIAKAMTTNNSSNVLSQQQAMQSIVDQEMTRLQNKQQNVDNAMNTQKRMMIMNDGFLKRQRMFSRISIAIAIGVFLILVFRYFSIQNEELSSLANVLSVFVIVTVFIYSLWTYIAIMRRDPIYFDQIAYIPDKLTPAPTGPPGGVYSPPNVNSQGLSNTQTVTSTDCVGPACCSTDNGTVWDFKTNSCISIMYTPAPTNNVS